MKKAIFAMLSIATIAVGMTSCSKSGNEALVSPTFHASIQPTKLIGQHNDTIAVYSSSFLVLTNAIANDTLTMEVSSQSDHGTVVTSIMTLSGDGLNNLPAVFTQDTVSLQTSITINSKYAGSLPSTTYSTH